MEKTLGPDKWIWVVVQDPGGNEQFLGQIDEKDNLAFIPVFLEKEDAQQCFMQMDRQKNLKYEIQAILYEELAKDAAKHGFMVFLLNANGEILEKLQP
jgi:hypothetical protein